MFLVAHPEVLADDWLPPVPVGRELETQELVRRLGAPRPASPPPWVAAVAGPSGSGTSTVARRAAREIADRLRETDSRSARTLIVRVADARGTHGVAAALLRRLDEGFDGRGFPTAEVLAGLLRRLRRESRPVVLVLDDVHTGGPDVAPVLRAVADPDRFLPEGEHGLPPIYALVAGGESALATAAVACGPRVPLRPFLTLAPYTPSAVGAIVRDRATRALGREPPAGWVDLIVEGAVADGGGARRAFDRLRRELLGGSRLGARRGADGVLVEPHVVEAIGQASQGSLARLGDVRHWEAKYAVRAGRPPLPTTTLWRRIVRLERAGYVKREIRTGGPGGTLSVLRVVTPVEEWVTVDRPRTRPIDGAAASSSSTTWAGPPPRGASLPGPGP